MDVASLADLLHETSERHGSFEAVAPPHDWWDWYAAYMDARQSGSDPEEASARRPWLHKRCTPVFRSRRRGSFLRLPCPVCRSRRARG